MDNWSDLSRRLWISALLLLIIFSLLFFSGNGYVDFTLTLLVMLLGSIAIWEYQQLASAKKLKPLSIIVMTLGACEILSFYLTVKFSFPPLFPLFTLFAALLILFLIHFKYSKEILLNISAEFFALSYIALPLGLLLTILFGQQELGTWWLAYLIIVTKITDIGGYFFGRLMGKHPLAPAISPKKTIEGAVGGFLLAIFTSILFTYFSPLPFQGFQAIWLGVLIGIFAQVGDLAESLLKRDALVKDSNSLPGLGGILDMLDSILITTPIVYFFINFI